MRRTIAAAALLALSSSPALAQQTEADPFIWTDPDTGCAYLVAPGTGITPRLRAEGVPDCPESDIRLSESFERTLRESSRALGDAFEELGRRLEEGR
ncbi:hypothetical protein [Salinarimonas ramus]|uniref:Uncharacterized protein n=1 Tax=Salinarimonas ramus TaxID=690164 RepID=A0A917V8D8_9HYPH|nr:hypothetical protein [Salinarimonas ramus]GGK49977.1 hypothetical protein GCM10011322_41290 [Salinarimonas ramus]